MKARGFTLIELLVVVAIISLLSSIVMVAVNDARAKGRNVERLQAVDTYRKALELARSTNGQYPQTGAYRCLGNPPDGICAGNRLVDAAIVTALSPHLPAFPLPPAPASLPGYDGMQYYTCPGPGACTGYPTTTYGIIWNMEGNTSCGPGAILNSYNATYNLTGCIYIHR